MNLFIYVITEFFKIKEQEITTISLETKTL